RVGLIIGGVKEAQRTLYKDAFQAGEIDVLLCSIPAAGAGLTLTAASETLFLERTWRPIYAIRPGAKGDISLKEDQTSNDWIAWSQKLAAPYNPSTLAYRDKLYVLYDFGLFGAFDAKTGEEVFEQTRFPKRSSFTASPWAYDGKVFCMNEDGVTYVMNAGDEFEVLHTNTLADDDMGMATPAIVGDRLLIRTSAR
ncbi:MAG: hypothetical protein IIB38_06470, partial [Candidatus Hydrogenedentes bacterium]|nr:hypothetical protein [Candidatus Hydrogenedentota bacterium]